MKAMGTVLEYRLSLASHIVGVWLKPLFFVTALISKYKKTANSL
jgi:hypothetical protein